MDGVLRKHGRIDVLVNNAGVSGFGLVEAYSLDQVCQLFEVNFYGVLRTYQAVLPAMRKAKKELIVNLSTGASGHALPFMAPYMASKYAVETVTEGIQEELRDYHIENVTIQSGVYPTEGTNGSKAGVLLCGRGSLQPRFSSSSQRLLVPVALFLPILFHQTLTTMPSTLMLTRMLTRIKSSFLLLLAVLLLLGSCREHDKYFDEAKPPKITAKEFATGLAGPLGLAVDPKGYVWVTEVGTGHNDGRVSVITPNGKVHPVITGFASVISPEGLAAGLGHLAYKDGVLYILNGVDGKLYLADVSSFKPGDAPRPVSALRAEDIAPFVVAYPFEVDTQFSNIYHLAFGPDGALYIADAGANAVIRRSPSGQLSVLAALPGIPHPSPGGNPTIDAVPTGIVYDGEKFLVSTLTGFPFPEGKARIYQVSNEGQVSVYRDSLTALVDIALGPGNRPVVLQFAAPGPQGFTPNSGQVIRSTASQNTVLLEGLNLPTGIARRSPNSYYVTSLADGKVLRVE